MPLDVRIRSTCSLAAALICFLLLLISLLALSEATDASSEKHRHLLHYHHSCRHHQHQHRHRHHHHQHHEQKKKQPHLNAADTTTDSLGHPQEVNVSSNPEGPATTFDMIVSGKRVGQPSRGANEGSAGRGSRSRREALNLAVNRLRILESLDDQLRTFALDLSKRKQAFELALSHGRRRRRHNQHCELPLNFGADQRRQVEKVNKSSGQPNFNTYRQADSSSSGGTKEEDEEEEEEEAEVDQVNSVSCLSSDHLRRQIPAYMLNLYTKLVKEARSLQEAVRLMPYRSLRMRSFRQPPAPALALALHHHSSLAGRSLASGQDEPPIELPPSSSPWTLLRSSSWSPQATQAQLGPPSGLQAALQEETFRSLVDEGELVVELNTMPRVKRCPNEAPTDQRGIQRTPEGSGGETTNLVEEGSLSTTTTTTTAATGTGTGTGTGAGAGARAGTGLGTVTVSESSPIESSLSSACRLDDRLRPARDRTQLCYWFRLATTPTIDGSLSPSSKESSLLLANEQLIEAELHLFKLQPDPKLLKRHRDQLNSSSSSGASMNEFHLRTNLLEVSLYQILPKKLGQGENPLRLLDIRRIDLDSSGWESFYVKRAVQDWLSDVSSNLGLVIKAKSMFDEPIRIGLIRFADLYDHYWPPFEPQLSTSKAHKSSATSSTAALNGQKRDRNWIRGASLVGGGGDGIHKEAIEFDLSHQPALVIYTSNAGKQKLQ